MNTAGVNGSNGLSNATDGFLWTAQTFRWDSLAAGTKVVVGMDLQTASDGQFDDDRIGWTTATSDTNSAYHFGVQLDYAGSPVVHGIYRYWKIPGTRNVNMTSWVPLTDTLANTWYRTQATFTKLTDASTAIDVSVQQLDAAGLLVGPVLTASLADTSALPVGDAPLASSFAGDLTPLYKNFNAKGGNADNISFSIVAVPEPATLSLLALAGLALGRRRHV